MNAREESRDGFGLEKPGLKVVRVTKRKRLYYRWSVVDGNQVSIYSHNPLPPLASQIPPSR
jgi:hypothetical protein